MAAIMPYSEPDNKEWILNKLIEINPKKVLDVGAGVGIYGDLIRTFLPETKIDAIEVFEPYIQQFGLNMKYHRVAICDVRDFKDYDYDVVIFGDVLEHMTREEAIAVWNAAAKQAKWGVITIPIIHNEQEAVFGNPYEKHVEEDWSTELVLESFSHIKEHREYPITGAFIAKFDNE